MDLDVAVIGPGAIGTTVAAALAEVGRVPSVHGRTARDGLTLRVAADDAVITVPGSVRVGVEGTSHPADVVFLAVKATQLDGAAAVLASRAGPGTVVCVLQNGVEQVESVAPLVPGASVVPAVVWFPAVHQEDGSVALLAPPRVTLPATEAADLVADLLAGTRCVVERADDFASAAWRKLLQNAAAGIMALTGRRAGVFRREDVAALTRGYLREGLAVARADGALLDDDVPEQVLDGFRSSDPDSGTSILADRVDGRPLEWDVRNGVIGRRARRHGIPTPIGDVLVTLLAATSDGPG